MDIIEYYCDEITQLNDEVSFLESKLEELEESYSKVLSHNQSISGTLRRTTQQVNELEYANRTLREELRLRELSDKNHSYTRYMSRNDIRRFNAKTTGKTLTYEGEFYQEATIYGTDNIISFLSAHYSN